MGKIKKVEAHIHLSIYCDCPHCDEQLDLMDIEQLTCEGTIHRLAVSEPFWGCEDADLDVECKECNEKFKIGRIYN